jgi:tetratricopeptide (TPR) repeat protein
MRSDRLNLALAAAATLGLACSHAKPAPTESVAAPEAPTASASPRAGGETAPVVVAEGSKLSVKGDAPIPETQPTAQPSHAASSSVRSAFAHAAEASSSGDTDGAIAALKGALSDDPKLPWAYYDLGALYERKGQYADALAAYRKALDVDGQFGDAGYAESRLLLRQKRLPEAEADLRARIDKQPGALGLRNALVYTLVQQGQLDPAVAEAKKVLKSDEKNADAMFQLATVYFKQGKSELALMVLTNAKAIHPDDPQLHNALGFVHIAMKEKALALEDFKKAAALSPDYAEAHNNLGALLNEAQDYPAAVKELETAVRDAPDFVSARLNLGNAYRGNQQYDRALAEYQKVLELAPTYKDALFNLAVLYFDGDFGQMSLSDRLGKASAYFDQFKSAGGDDPRIDQYRKDLTKLLAADKRRQERDSKDKLKKAQKDKAEAAKAAAADAAKQRAAEAQAAKSKAEPSATVEGAKLKQDDAPTVEGASLGQPPAKKTPPASSAGGTKLKDTEAPNPSPAPAPAPTPGDGKLGGGDEK